MIAALKDWTEVQLIGLLHWFHITKIIELGGDILADANLPCFRGIFCFSSDLVYFEMHSMLLFC